MGSGGATWLEALTDEDYTDEDYKMIDAGTRLGSASLAL